jgi:hypothetical protein
MKKTINISFNFGQTVVLKTDPSTPRVISGMIIRPLPQKGVFITYGLAKGDEETWHNDCEIATMRNIFKVKGFK